eukprot:1583794-Pleurochrysis_carterae.AAC.1
MLGRAIRTARIDSRTVARRAANGITAYAVIYFISLWIRHGDAIPTPVRINLQTTAATRCIYSAVTPANLAQPNAEQAVRKMWLGDTGAGMHCV